MFGYSVSMPTAELVGQTVWWICFSEIGAKISFEGGDEIIFYDLPTFAQSQGWSIDECRSVLIGLCHSELSGFILADERIAIFSFSNDVKLALPDYDTKAENFAFLINGELHVV